MLPPYAVMHRKQLRKFGETLHNPRAHIPIISVCALIFKDNRDGSNCTVSISPSRALQTPHKAVTIMRESHSTGGSLVVPYSAKQE
jgi:hypothetical protein